MVRLEKSKCWCNTCGSKGRKKPKDLVFSVENKYDLTRLTLCTACRIQLLRLLIRDSCPGILDVEGVETDGNDNS